MQIYRYLYRIKLNRCSSICKVKLSIFVSIFVVNARFWNSTQKRRTQKRFVAEKMEKKNWISILFLLVLWFVIVWKMKTRKIHRMHINIPQRNETKRSFRLICFARRPLYLYMHTDWFTSTTRSPLRILLKWMEMKEVKRSRDRQK